MEIFDGFNSLDEDFESITFWEALIMSLKVEKVSFMGKLHNQVDFILVF